MKGMNNTPWPSFPNAKDTQDMILSCVVQYPTVEDQNLFL